MVAAVRLLARLVALLDHVVKLFAGGEDKGGGAWWIGSRSCAKVSLRGKP
jgi:hypothetical protein